MSSASDATLHLLTAHRELAVPAALRPALRAGDRVILLQEGAWLALADRDEVWAGVPEGVWIAVLEADLAVRGLASRALHRRVTRIDDAGWVAASEQCLRCITWGAR
jgi:sulfur relay protein TusB/DsrH